ncbi:MAG TPA: hypothetical protein VLF66_06425, partial [Thermoanaerobaculia bacterium]|nr:hypothetical protein [Thermoanaerobaculia bacterium]
PSWSPEDTAIVHGLSALLELVNESGWLGQMDDESRRSLGADAQALLAAAEKLSEENRRVLTSGHLTAEDFQLAVKIETLVAGFGLSALGALQGLGGEPGAAPGVESEPQR